MGSIFSGEGLQAGLDAARQYVSGVFIGDPVEITLKIVRSILDLVGLAAVVVLIIAGIRLITSMGEDEPRDHAKRMIRNVLIGIILIVLSRVIVSWVLQSVTDALR